MLGDFFVSKIVYPSKKKKRKKINEEQHSHTSYHLSIHIHIVDKKDTRMPFDGMIIAQLTMPYYSQPDNRKTRTLFGTNAYTHFIDYISIMMKWNQINSILNRLDTRKIEEFSQILYQNNAYKFSFKKKRNRYRIFCCTNLPSGFCLKMKVEIN